MSSWDVTEPNLADRGGAVPSVLDRSIVKMYDYINHVVITLPLTIYEGT